MKKLRQCTVEPVLGTLINFLALKRINTRGIKLANKCMIMAAIAYNIKTLMKFKTTKVLSNAMALREFIADSYCLPNSLMRRPSQYWIFN